MDKLSFINSLKIPAQRDMLKTKILASLTMAQAILESGWGTSELSTKANNYFGIKAGKFYQGESVSMPTTEFRNGSNVMVQALFRKYSNIQDSLEDHSNLFLTNSRYSNLIGERSYIKACNNVKKDGYATDQDYTDKLISIIKQNKLYQIDLCIENRGLIKIGEISQRVGVLQFLLSQWGFALTIDNIFGKETLNAVKHFQDIRKIAVDGIVGNITVGQF